jgi:methylase of polypeptide subunit release factors
MRWICSEKWDIVVANPPHFGTLVQKFGYGPLRYYLDQDWMVHKRFYQSIKKHLNSGGRIITQEHALASHEDTFRSMIEDNGMQIEKVDFSEKFPDFYYIHVTAV